MKLGMKSNVQRNMRFKGILFASFILTLLACGGGGADVGVGSVSGLVLDLNGNPIRGARVFTVSGTPRETFTTTAGSFQLNGVDAVSLPLRAEITQNGVEYAGENTAQVFRGENAQSINIVMARSNLLTSLAGTVVSSGGFRIQGGIVVAKPVGARVDTSTQTITDREGRYHLKGLVAGQQYEVMAKFPGFRADDVLIIPQAGIQGQRNFTLQNSAQNPNIPFPQGLFVVAYTSPGEITRDVKQQQALMAVKKMLNPKYRSGPANSRTTALGNPVEMQLYWNLLDSQDVLGYGIERRRSVDSFREIDFLEDPLATGYLDSDSSLRPDLNYSYRIYRGDSNYSVNNPTGSDYSDVAVGNALSDLTNVQVSTLNNQVQFSWNLVNGAEYYTTYIFTDYPGIGVDDFANNFQNPSTGNSFNYTASGLRPLVRGQRYYYLIVGAADYNNDNNDDAYTLSSIGTFIAP